MERLKAVYFSLHTVNKAVFHFCPVEHLCSLLKIEWIKTNLRLKKPADQDTC